MFLPLVTYSRSPITLAPVVRPTSCLIEPRYSTLSDDTQSGPVRFATAAGAATRARARATATVTTVASTPRGRREPNAQKKTGTHPIARQGTNASLGARQLLVLVEPAARLAPVVARYHHALEQRRRRVLRALELLAQRVADRVEHVEADEVRQRQRPHRVACPETHALVDVLARREALLVHPHRRHPVRPEQRVNDEPRTVLRSDRALADPLDELDGARRR